MKRKLTTELADCPWRQPQSSASSSRSRYNPENFGEVAFITFLWGTDMVYQIEAWKVGTNLKKSSSRRRILFYDEEVHKKGLFHLLQTVWEMHQFEHLQTTKGGHAKRLEKVYSKMFVS